MKAHIGADADSGLVHTVRGTSGNVHDVVEGNLTTLGSGQPSNARRRAEIFKESA